MTDDDMAGTPSPKPACDQHFPSTISTTSQEPSMQRPQRKRSRDLADVDGDNSDTTQRKKRRLRRDLITSRLSRPYATPATHIISRNAVRLGIWTGRRYIGRNVFRKAAILNSMRREKANECAERGIVLPQPTSFEASDGRVDADIAAVDKKSSREIAVNDFPPRSGADAPSPVLLPAATNYDIFDDEDTDPDAEDELHIGMVDDSDPDSEDSDEVFPFDDIYSGEHAFDPPPKADHAWQRFSQQSHPLTGR